MNMHALNQPGPNADPVTWSRLRRERDARPWMRRGATWAAWLMLFAIGAVWLFKEDVNLFVSIAASNYPHLKQLIHERLLRQAPSILPDRARSVAAGSATPNSYDSLDRLPAGWLTLPEMFAWRTRNYTSPITWTQRDFFSTRDGWAGCIVGDLIDRAWDEGVGMPQMWSDSAGVPLIDVDHDDRPEVLFGWRQGARMAEVRERIALLSVGRRAHAVRWACQARYSVDATILIELDPAAQPTTLRMIESGLEGDWVWRFEWTPVGVLRLVERPEGGSLRFEACWPPLSEGGDAVSGPRSVGARTAFNEELSRLLSE